MILGRRLQRRAHRGVRVQATLLLSWMCASCATAPLAPYFLDPTGAAHADCNPVDHIAAVGRSKAGQSDAEQAARQALVRQISSSIQVETERVVAVAKENGVFTASRSLSTTGVERAAFSHAELIRTLGAPGKQEDETWVLVCLDRKQAASALVRDVAPSLAKFEAAHQRASVARTAGNHGAFTVAFSEAADVAPELLHGFGELRALRGAGTSVDDGLENTEGKEEISFREGWADLLKNAGLVRGEAVVKILVDKGDFSARDARTAGDAFREAVSQLGLVTSMTEGSCEKNQGAYVLSVKPAANCSWGPLGHTCTPQFAVLGLECQGEEPRLVFESEMKDPALRGNHARDEGQALKRALKGLTAELLEPRLRELLRREVPLDDPGAVTIAKQEPKSSKRK